MQEGANLTHLCKKCFDCNNSLYLIQPVNSKIFTILKIGTHFVKTYVFNCINLREKCLSYDSGCNDDSLFPSLTIKKYYHQFVMLP